MLMLAVLMLMMLMPAVGRAGACQGCGCSCARGRLPAAGRLPQCAANCARRRLGARWHGTRSSHLHRRSSAAGEPLSDEEVTTAHYDKVCQLQRLAFKHIPQLRELALAHCGAVEKRDSLKRFLQSLSEEQLRFLVRRGGAPP